MDAVDGLGWGFFLYLPTKTIFPVVGLCKLVLRTEDSGLLCVLVGQRVQNSLQLSCPSYRERVGLVSKIPDRTFSPYISLLLHDFTCENLTRGRNFRLIPEYVWLLYLAARSFCLERL